MMSERDAYTVLQVAPDADHVVVQAAYRALARRFHADGAAPDAGRMVEINGAWERVRTPQRRDRYDRERRRAPVAVGPGRTVETGGQPERFDPWAHVGATESTPRADPDVIDFGQYAGWRIADVARHDPDYLRWLSRHSTGIRYLAAIARCLPGDRSVGRRTSMAG